ncbi:hypothetical protein [Phycicoccus sp. Soil748]|uniref:hypothetical protein n=1 Tax=Phycicoccus sp. Soil748 TaxID=1736397 RepID=UPI00070375F0|nr:hypothetical protein [Phycicoccus sp. Soil748]KRE52724.1 hypothetical protein ASG70_15315 [Phycicoccus sp. Soil748]
MTRRRQHTSTARLVAALGVAGALVCGGATASQALTLPDPVATTVGDVTSTVTGATGGLGLPVPGATTTAPGSGSGTTPASHPSGTSTTSATPGAQGGSSKSGTSSATEAKGSKGSAASTGGSAVVDSPAATACIIPTGGTSPAVEVDLRAAGVDLSSPLVKQFPQALAPCPEGAVPAGDHVASVDAAAQGLLGACVRVTRQVVPLQTTLVVLDHDVIRELTAAGVPLDRLVVPCPGAAGSPAPGNVPSAPAAHDPSAGGRPGAASALPVRLAFTGGAVVPMALAGAGMLWLGVLMTRRARGLSGVAGRG